MTKMQAERLLEGVDQDERHDLLMYLAEQFDYRTFRRDHDPDADPDYPDMKDETTYYIATI